MSRFTREERLWARRLVLVKEARADGARTRAITERLARHGLLEPDEIELLRHGTRRHDVTRTLLAATTPSKRVVFRVMAAVMIGDSVLAWWLVGGSHYPAVALVVALSTQAVAAVLFWGGPSAATWASGPRISIPPSVEGEAAWVVQAGADRYLAFRRFVDVVFMATAPIGAALVIASAWRGVAAVAVTASLVTYDVWSIVFVAIQALSLEAWWRFLVPKDRAVSSALAVSVDLTWCLAKADLAVPTRHGPPLWLTAYFRAYPAYFGRLFFVMQWVTGATHGWRRRQELMRIDRALMALMHRYADRFEQAGSADQHGAAVLEIRDHLRRALSGDLSFLELDTAAPWWRRTLPRALSAAVLVAAAIALPYLPGVTASATTLAGIQVGLAVTAVLTLVGTPAEAQKSVAEAMKSASAGK